MPKSILEIEVNDEQFRAYVETFNRYQEQLKQMPSPWKDVGQEASAVVTSIAAMSTALDLHYDKVRKLAELEKEEAEEKKKADEEHKRRLEEQSDIEKDNEARRRKAIDQTKAIAKNVADTAISLGKWALLGEGAALIGGALGLWGLDKFVEGIGRERQMAQGLGVTTGERQGLSIQMSRYFNVNSVLENIAEAQADPAKRWTFSAMGVNQTGKDPAQLALEMATRAREIFVQGRGNEQYARAHGLLNVYSMDELRTLAATRPQDLATSVGAARRDFAFGLSDKDSKMWQTFVIKVQEAGRQIENIFITKLSQLNDSGALTDLITDFTMLAKTVLDKVDFTKLGQGLETLSKYIGDGNFQKDFKSFIDDIAAVASKLVDALVWFNIIPAHGPISTPKGVPTPTVTQTGGGFGGSALGGGTIVDTLAIKGGGQAGTGVWEFGATQTAGQQLEKWGWTPDQAKGILSNLRAESHMNPFAIGDKGLAYGIGQWHPGEWRHDKYVPGRQEAYATLFGHTMQSVKNPQQALTEQLEFVQWELTQGGYKRAGADLRKAQSAYDAGYTITTEYELPKNKEAVGVVRGLGAMTITIVNQTGHAVAATANAASR
jgi:Phage tail lysozyme